MIFFTPSSFILPFTHTCDQAGFWLVLKCIWERMNIQRECIWRSLNTFIESVPGIEFRSADFIASAFSGWAIMLAHSMLLLGSLGLTCILQLPVFFSKALLVLVYLSSFLISPSFFSILFLHLLAPFSSKLLLSFFSSSRRKFCRNWICFLSWMMRPHGRPITRSSVR